MSTAIPCRSVMRAARRGLVCALLRWPPMGLSAAADRAQFADGVTTLVGLGRDDISELNGLFRGLNGWEILAIKLTLTQAVKFTPPEFCRPGLMGLTLSLIHI